MDLRRLDPTGVGAERRAHWLLIAVFAAVVGLAVTDLVGDLREGTTIGHAVVEGSIAIVGAVGIVTLLTRLAAARRGESIAQATAAELAADLEGSRAEAERWRDEARDLSQGLGELIDRQFGRWGLTPAERDVALLLLKGLSHKEVAAIRGVGEATARQQSTAVYRKAGVSGRHDLAAFFLEDMLAPRADVVTER
ncbi:MAG: helix-turn-helix transcriptional regulator [Planctomycetes bacterium]|nr:helix-turn-helix transcriptional regulator [Planctomycetota bacterium]